MEGPEEEEEEEEEEEDEGDGAGEKDVEDVFAEACSGSSAVASITQRACMVPDGGPISNVRRPRKVKR